MNSSFIIAYFFEKARGKEDFFELRRNFYMEKQIFAKEKNGSGDDERKRKEMEAALRRPRRGRRARGHAGSAGAGGGGHVFDRRCGASLVQDAK